MNMPAIIEGTLKPDGTLELDQKPNLTPGRVQVIVQPLSRQISPKRHGLADVIEEIRQAQLARGYSGCTKEEMEAEEAVRQTEQDDYDQRMRDLWAQTQSGPLPGNP